MKLSLILCLLSAAVLAGCNPKSDNNNKFGETDGKMGSGSSDLSELVLNDFKLLKKINFKDSEKENYVQKTEDGDVERTKFFYMIQENQIVMSEKADKTQARCTISISKKANESVDNLFLDEQNLTSPDSFQFDSDASNKNGVATSKATLRLRFGVLSQNLDNKIEVVPLDINCWEVMSKAELNKQINTFLTFKKHEEKK